MKSNLNYIIYPRLLIKLFEHFRVVENNEFIVPWYKNAYLKVVYRNPSPSLPWEIISVPVVRPAYGTTGLLLVSHGKGLVFRVITQEWYFNKFRIISQDGRLIFFLIAHGLLSMYHGLQTFLAKFVFFHKFFYNIYLRIFLTIYKYQEKLNIYFNKFLKLSWLFNR